MAQNVRTESSYRTDPANRDRDVVVGYEERTTILPFVGRRISWGAIIAGVVLAVVIQIALHLLGLSIGANTINPETEAVAVDPSLRNGAVIWVVASTLISLFAGGVAAGYLAGRPENTDGIMHGLIVWAVVTLLTLMLLTSSTMSFVSGVTNALGNVISATAQGVASVAQSADDVAPELSRTVQNIAPELGDALGIETSAVQNIDNEIMSLVGQVSEPEMTAGEVEEQVDEAAATAEEAVQSSIQNPTQAGQEISAAVQRISNLEVVEDADRQDVVNLIASNTNLTQEEAEQTLTRWETSLRDARTQVTQSVEEAGQAMADAVAALAGILFVIMVMGAFAAGAGGLVGSPDPERMHTDVETRPAT